VKAAFNQNTPRDFQLDVAEALILGLDATVVAGTGSGKTLPWAMPLLLDENRERACLVISPLKALQADHVSCWKTGDVSEYSSLTGPVLLNVGYTRNCRQQRYLE
jgi:superfamily II DNA helicase RecQ